MINDLKIASAQMNFMVGDLQGNYEKTLECHKQAHDDGANIIVFSEMSITGYPPEDLVLRPDFQDKAIKILHDLAEHTNNGTAMLVGCLWREGNKIYNAVALLDEGEIKHVTCKYDLPNYGVFDEKRVFATPPFPEPVDFRGVSLGVVICEDLWNFKTAPHMAKQGAEIIISMNASPFEADKHKRRMEVVQKNVAESSLPLIYINQVCGQDELIFEGDSFIVSKEGAVLTRQKKWQESIQISHWKKKSDEWVCTAPREKFPEPCKHQEIYEAIKLALRDYVNKNNFPGVIIGLSGGIDSALTAAIATDALGPSRVRAVMMPSKYTSKESLEEAAECAKLLEIHLDNIPIEKPVAAMDKTLVGAFEGMQADLTEENIQSRLRGVILMALSNKFGYMVLTTGNKSEMAVGYATLYGDMCGGYSVLKDIYKTEVFAMAKWRNEISRVIPENTISKPPSAELRDDQKDEDSLPPYDMLDDILIRLIELRHSSKQIIEHGYAPEIVHNVAKLVKISEYKRRQAPPGAKISGQAFGKDRRYPITNTFEF